MIDTAHVTCPLCRAATDHTYELFDFDQAAGATHLGLTCRGPVPHRITVAPARDSED